MVKLQRSLSNQPNLSKYLKKIYFKCLYIELQEVQNFITNKKALNCFILRYQPKKTHPTGSRKESASLLNKCIDINSI
jgi:hypothetical protein